MKLSKCQVSLFWRLWSVAEAESIGSGATREERDTLRRSVMLRSCGKITLKDVGPTGDFDRLMYEVATMSGDYRQMAYWCQAKERRTSHMIGECARQIGEIAGQSKGWEYCRSVFSQAGLPKRWDDIPEHLLFATFQMLDTHRRRMLKRDHGWRGERSGQPLGFSPDRIYVRSGLALKFYDPLPAARPSPLPLTAASA